MALAHPENPFTVTHLDLAGEPVNALQHDGTLTGGEQIAAVARGYGYPAQVLAAGTVQIELPGRRWPESVSAGMWLVATETDVAVVGKYRFHTMFRSV